MNQFSDRACRNEPRCKFGSNSWTLLRPQDSGYPIRVERSLSRVRLSSAPAWPFRPGPVSLENHNDLFCRTAGPGRPCGAHRVSGRSFAFAPGPEHLRGPCLQCPVPGAFLPPREPGQPSDDDNLHDRYAPRWSPGGSQDGLEPDSTPARTFTGRVSAGVR